MTSSARADTTFRPRGSRPTSAVSEPLNPLDDLRRTTTPVLVTADVQGQTQAGFDAILEALRTAFKTAPGFILVTGHPVEGSWRTLEVWDTAEEAAAFYARFVHPNLPPGFRPRRTFQPLQALVSATPHRPKEAP